MARKTDVVKKIDIKTTSTGAPLPLIQEDQIAPAAFYVIPAPDTLVELSQAIVRSTQAPLVAVALSWNEAPNIAPDYYNVEWSESSTFSDVQRRRANTTSATIEGLKANGVTYYFRVQAVMGGIYSAFSDTLTVVTMTDNTPPPDVTGASAAYENSDLVITYTIPQSEIIKDIEVKIYNAAHTILYATLYPTTNRVVWTAEQNIFATGGNPLKSVSIDIHTRSWSNFLSVTGVNVTATAPLPSTPTGYTSNWISDNGTAHADFITSWLGAANANDYELTIDGKNYYTRDLKFVYHYEQNVADHKPTLASGDPSFVWLLKARDKLGQSSIPVNVTVTNAAPPSGVMSMQVQAGFSTIAATVALLGNTIVQDFDHYEWELFDGSSIIQRISTPDPTLIFQVNSAGTYTPSVVMVDKFNQKSATLSGSPTILDTLTIAQLRAETTYVDSTGATSPTLDFFKDGVGVGGTSKLYGTVASGTYQWVEARRPLLDRYKTITFTGTYGGITLAYLTFNDGTTDTYYAGPITTTTAGAKVLTKYTVLATAIANAFRLDLLGTTRIDLPNVQEARTVRMSFSDYGGTMPVYEYYPRRLVQSDDIEAENIKGINIAAAAVTADKISVTVLSAITAFIGQLNIDTTGWLYQGTGTGNSPTTGLKIFNSGGIGKLSTYNAGVEQVTLDTDGKLKAAAGRIILSKDGLQFFGSNIDSTTYINFYNTSGTKIWEQAAYTGTTDDLVFTAQRSTSTFIVNAGAYVRIQAGVTGDSYIILDNSKPYVKVPFLVVGQGIASAPGGSNLYVEGSATVNANFVVNGTSTLNGQVDVWGNLIAHNNIYWGSGGNYLSAYLNQALLTTSVVTFGRITNSTYYIGGSTGVDYLPNSGNWGSGGTTMILQGNDFSSIGFHDAGSRVDFIVGGQGIIRVGYDGGWGAAVVTMPGGARVGAAGVYIGNTGTVASYLIHLSADSAGKPNGGSWTNSSDERLKIIHGNYERGLNDLRKLQPILFEWNGKGGIAPDGVHAGFSAQATRKVTPEWITTIKGEIDGEETDILQLNSSDLPLMLRNAVIELEDRLNKLERKLR